MVHQNQRENGSKGWSSVPSNTPFRVYKGRIFATQIAENIQKRQKQKYGNVLNTTKIMCAFVTFQQGVQRFQQNTEDDDMNRITT